MDQMDFSRDIQSSFSMGAPTNTLLEFREGLPHSFDPSDSNISPSTTTPFSHYADDSSLLCRDRMIGIDANAREPVGGSTSHEHVSLSGYGGAATDFLLSSSSGYSEFQPCHDSDTSSPSRGFLINQLGSLPSSASLPMSSENVSGSWEQPSACSIIGSSSENFQNSSLDFSSSYHPNNQMLPPDPPSLASLGDSSFYTASFHPLEPSLGGNPPSPRQPNSLVYGMEHHSPSLRPNDTFGSASNFSDQFHGSGSDLYSNRPSEVLGQREVFDSPLIYADQHQTQIFNDAQRLHADMSVLGMDNSTLPSTRTDDLNILSGIPSSFSNQFTNASTGISSGHEQAEFSSPSLPYFGSTIPTEDCFAQSSDAERVLEPDDRYMRALRAAQTRARLVSRAQSHLEAVRYLQRVRFLRNPLRQGNSKTTSNTAQLPNLEYSDLLEKHENVTESDLDRNSSAHLNFAAELLLSAQTLSNFGMPQSSSSLAGLAAASDIILSSAPTSASHTQISSSTSAVGENSFLSRNSGNDPVAPMDMNLVLNPHLDPSSLGFSQPPSISVISPSGVADVFDPKLFSHSVLPVDMSNRVTFILPAPVRNQRSSRGRSEGMGSSSTSRGRNNANTRRSRAREPSSPWNVIYNSVPHHSFGVKVFFKTAKSPEDQFSATIDDHLFSSPYTYDLLVGIRCDSSEAAQYFESFGNIRAQLSLFNAHTHEEIVAPPKSPPIIGDISGLLSHVGDSSDFELRTVLRFKFATTSYRQFGARFCLVVTLSRVDHVSDISPVVGPDGLPGPSHLLTVRSPGFELFAKKRASQLRRKRLLEEANSSAVSHSTLRLPLSFLSSPPHSGDVIVPGTSDSLEFCSSLPFHSAGKRSREDFEAFVSSLSPEEVSLLCSVLRDTRNQFSGDEDDE